MTEPLPEPPVPEDCDLRDFAFMPLDVRRLLTSETWLTSNGEEKAAAMTLWLESWHQVPAGSLPENDRMLAILSQAGAARWKKVKAVALRGWKKCRDGRLYHSVVCEKANEAWQRKQLQRERSRRGNEARWGGSPKDGNGKPNPNPDRAEDASIHPSRSPNGILEAIPKSSHSDPTAIPKGSRKESLNDPKGQGQGQGDKEETSGGGESESPPRELRSPPGCAFRGSIIRLNADDFEAWRRAYPSYPDLAAELTAIDAKLAEQRHEGAWFGKVSGWLKAGHERRMRAKSAEKAPPSPEDEDLVLRSVLTAWVARGGRTADWPEGRGVPPGRPGCQIPHRLLAEFNLLPIAVGAKQ